MPAAVSCRSRRCRCFSEVASLSFRAAISEWSASIMSVVSSAVVEELSGGGVVTAAAEIASMDADDDVLLIIQSMTATAHTCL